MMKTALLIIAIVLLVVSLIVKGYGMVQLANKKLTPEERMARYKKTMLPTYMMLAPTILIVIYLLMTK